MANFTSRFYLTCKNYNLNQPIRSSLLRITAVVFMLAAFNPGVVSGQLLQQDFTGVNPITQYVSATPTNQQFTAIGSSGAGTTVSAATAKLVYTCSAASGTFSRIQDFSPVPTTLKYSLDLSVTCAAGATNVAQFKVGAGFSNAHTPELNTSTYGRFGVDYVATDKFRIRDLVANNNTNTGLSAANYTFSGTQTITWYLNNSGSSLSYMAPGGSSETVANDKMDIWVGTTKVFNDINPLTPALNMTDLKFIINGGNGSVAIDNINITTAQCTFPATVSIPQNVTCPCLLYTSDAADD